MQCKQMCKTTGFRCRLSAVFNGYCIKHNTSVKGCFSVNDLVELIEAKLKKNIIITKVETRCGEHNVGVCGKLNVYFESD